MIQGYKAVGEGTFFVISLSLAGRRRRKESKNFNSFESGCPSKTPAAPQTQSFITTILLEEKRGFKSNLMSIIPKSDRAYPQVAEPPNGGLKFSCFMKYFL